MIFYALEVRLDRLRVAEHPGERDISRLKRLDRLTDLRKAGLVDIRQRQLAPRLREGFGDGAAQTSGRAEDKRDAVFNPKLHSQSAHALADGLNRRFLPPPALHGFISLPNEASVTASGESDRRW